MAQLPEHAKDKAIEIWSQTKPASVSKVHGPAFGPDGERDRARHATDAASGLTFLAPSVRNAALRRRSSYPPPIPMQCPCIWPKSAAASRRERMRRSSSIGQAITSRRDSPFHPTSRSSACRPTHQSSSRVENVWEYLKLAITVFESYDDIVDKSCAAWRFFADDHERVASITSRTWATVIP